MSLLKSIDESTDIRALSEAREHIDARIAHLRDEGRRAALERLSAEAAALGFESSEQLIGVRKRGRPRATSTNGHDHVAEE